MKEDGGGFDELVASCMPVDEIYFFNPPDYMSETYKEIFKEYRGRVGGIQNVQSSHTSEYVTRLLVYSWVFSVVLSEFQKSRVF